MIPLNSSFGKEKTEQNGHVISFNVAGSSFAQPLRYEEGVAGKTNIFLDDLTTGGTVHHIGKNMKMMNIFLLIKTEGKPV